MGCNAPDNTESINFQRAFYVLVLGRMSREERTRAYVIKRIAEGKTNKEIIRCLKRYVPCEIYRVLGSPSRPPHRQFR